MYWLTEGHREPGREPRCSRSQSSGPLLDHAIPLQVHFRKWQTLQATDHKRKGLQDRSLNKKRLAVGSKHPTGSQILWDFSPLRRESMLCQPFRRYSAKVLLLHDHISETSHLFHTVSLHMGHDPKPKRVFSPFPSMGSESGSEFRRSRKKIKSYHCPLIRVQVFLEAAHGKERFLERQRGDGQRCLTPSQWESGALCVLQISPSVTEKDTCSWTWGMLFAILSSLSFDVSYRKRIVVRVSEKAVECAF